MRRVLVAAACAASVLGVVATPAAQAGAGNPLGDVAVTNSGTLGDEPVWTSFLSYGDPDEPGAIVLEAPLGFLACVQGDNPLLAGDTLAFFALATNGVDDPIHYGVRPEGGSSTPVLTTESALLAQGVNLAPEVGEPDFHGYELTTIRAACSSAQFGPGDEFETTTEFSFAGLPLTITTLSCVPDGGVQACTVGDPDGIRTVMVRNTATKQQEAFISAECSDAPPTAEFTVPLGTKYKVSVKDCDTPRNLTSFVIRANGTVHQV